MKKLLAIAVIGVLAFTMTGFTSDATAGSRPKLERRVDEAITSFYEKSYTGKELAQKAKGMLVFPKVYKAGIGIGGEYGKGALRVGGQTVGYYSTTSGSIGFQLGGQKRTQILLFMTNKALEGFRNSDGWEIGVDGSVALIDLGTGADLDTNSIKDPIVGFVFGNEGLMYNLSLEGTKISRLDD
jgi:lipid-binding SYLF domain-containing protein